MEEIKLSAAEQERYDTIRDCIDGNTTNTEASIRLGLKVRWVQMLKRSVEKNGKNGVILSFNSYFILFLNRRVLGASCFEKLTLRSLSHS